MLLSDDISAIKGVGEKKANILKSAGILTVGSLLEYFPRDYNDRSNVKCINQLVENEENTFVAYVDSAPENTHIGKLIITKARLKDDTGGINVVWYNQAYIKKALKKDEKYIFTGVYHKKNYRKEVVVSEFEKIDLNEPINAGRIVPVYPLTTGLTQKVLRNIIKTTIVDIRTQIIDFMPVDIRKEYNLCDRNFAISNIHFPEDDDSFFIARRRLVFEELFVLQMALFVLKGSTGVKSGPIFSVEGAEDICQNAMGFNFTNAQKRVINDIKNDFLSGIEMNRLIQGDVGSGKTAVAITVAFMAVKSGYQAALMAPTEVLANQHYETFKNFFDIFDIEVCILNGSIRKKEKDLIKADILSGKAKIVIGTHAIIQKDVEFNNLGLVITDEQHRFGVKQRNILSKKGKNTHVIVMTATPIPRTLALILYGDLSISVINELPPGRQKIETYAVNSSYHSRAYSFVRKNVEQGGQAYIVCPMVEESDVVEAKAVQTLIKEVSENDFKGLKIAVLHGKMKPTDKESVMRDFANGKTQILISTTVIEVGVNVPNATIMLIENAERFGLSQLHQLRGRVGRGDRQSYCILISDAKNDIAKERMNVMKKTNDGFEISETDLKLRGPGEFFGTKQHGVPQFKIANLYKDADILSQAQKAAVKLNKDNNWRKRKNYELLAQKVDKLFFDGERIEL